MDTKPDPYTLRRWALARLPGRKRARYERLSAKFEFGRRAGVDAMDLSERRELGELNAECERLEAELLAHWQQGAAERAARRSFSRSGEFEAKRL